MSEISVYDIVPTPKLADKLIGTSVGGVIPDVTYNFTLEELLQLFIPVLPANNLQGVLDYGNTATQDINLTGTINTTDLNVFATANILDSILSGETHITGELYDGLDSKGTAGQVLTSTGSGVEWYTIPTVIPTLQQVLTSGNTADKNIILTANITAVTATATNVVSNTSLAVNGVLKDGTASAGGSNQILSSTGSGVQWVDMPVYNAVSPLLYDNPTKTFSIQVANASQGGYLSNTDWINFDGKQDPILLTTTGTSGASTFVGNTLNIPIYTPDLSGYVPTSRTLTINGITYDLSANRSWTIPAGVAEVTATSPLFSTGGAYPDISIQIATTSQDGYLSATDWNTFNAKQGALTLTTTGTSGPSTLVGDTLNIPQYQSVLTNPITGLGTTNYVSKFTSASSIGNSNIQDSGSLITLGSNTTISSGSLGIGTSSLTGVTLALAKTMTGATSVQGINNIGVIQSDVTTSALYYQTFAQTQAASFSIGSINHYYANQGTFGAGSTVTSQHGFYVSPSLIGATNNYGFRGGIPSGTGRWNLYMDGTANNYLAGSLGIGSTSLGATNGNLNIAKAITGGTSANGINNQGQVQSDVTNAVLYNNVTANTQAATFTLGSLVHYYAQQGTFGAGSTVTNQIGFSVSPSLIGATNNYGFRGSIPAQTNAWNIYMDGTANNYLAGSLGIGTTSLTGINLFIQKSITGATSAYSVAQNGIIQSDVTSSAFGFNNNLNTQAAAFTLGSYYHFRAYQNTLGAGSTVTTQVGYIADSSLIGATNNYGFRGSIPSGTNRWNLYMDGTADNYLAGSLGIGGIFLTGLSLAVTKNITGATTSYGIVSNGTAQSDVTSQAILFGTVARTQATTYTLSALHHFSASQGTFGAGSSVNTQRGFFVESTLIGATNNHGFFGDIPAGTGRWNIYMSGTAQNYLAGALSIGVATANASALLQVDSTTKGFLPPRMTAAQRAAIATPAEGLIVFQTDGTIGLYVYANATWRTLAMV